MRSAPLRLVLPFGFYGAGNTGDEATLSGFARLVAGAPHEVSVWAGSQNPAHTRRIVPAFRYFHNSGFDLRRVYVKRRAQAFAVAGGTPIQDVLGSWPFSELRPHILSLDRLKIPMAFIGVGIEGLQHEESHRVFETEFVPRVRHWSIRSPRGVSRLTAHGVPSERITVAADMAWLLDPPSRDFGAAKLTLWGLDPGRPVIAINIVNENAVFDKHPQMAPALAAALDEIARARGAQLLFLCAEVRESDDFDKAAARRVIACLKRPDSACLAPTEYFSPLELMSIVSCCQLSISMRYHFCVFSAMSGVPFIAIQRTDKLVDLCNDLEWTGCVAPPVLAPDEMVAHDRRIHENAQSLVAALRSRMGVLKDRAKLNIVALDSLLQE